MIGHELRNPMAVINNSAYFVKAKLKSGGALDPKVEKHLGIIEAEIARADRLIGDILAYSRPLELKAAACALDRFVEGALKGYAFPAGLRVDKKLGAGSAEVKIDAACLGEALRRILDNAVEAMPEGGTLGVKTSQEGKSLVIAVSNTGPAIPKESLKDVFLPFFATKPRGLGLGLAIALKAVAAHGGSIQAESPATFRILLPRP